MKAADGSETAKRPGRDGAGAFLESGSNDFRSIAAVHQAPARAPRRRNQSARIAAAVAVTIAGAEDGANAAAPNEAAATATRESLRNMVVSLRFGAIGAIGEAADPCRPPKPVRRSVD